MRDLYKKLNIPENCRMKSRVALSQIYQVGDFKTSEQKAISRVISKIYLIAEINGINFNIKGFKDDNYIYETIQFVYVELLRINEMEWVDELLHKLFPNPVVLVYSFKEDIAISIGLKRLNKVENNKTVIQDISNTLFTIDDGFYTSFSNIIKESKNSDLFTLYQKLYKIVFMQKIYDLIGSKQSNLDFTEVKNLYNEIRLLEKENEQYNVQFKAERNESKKMELFMKIKKNEIKIKENIDKIGG